MFSERMVGDNRPGHAAPINYMMLEGPLERCRCGRGEGAVAVAWGCGVIVGCV